MDSKTMDYNSIDLLQLQSNLYGLYLSVKYSTLYNPPFRAIMMVKCKLKKPMKWQMDLKHFYQSFIMTKQINILASSRSIIIII